MDPQEVGKLLFAPLIRRQADRRVVELALGTLQLHIVHGEKCDGRMEGCAFVTVHKGMILGEMESVGSRDVEQIDSGIVKISILRLRQGRLKQAFVAYARLASEKRNLLSVKGEDLVLI